MGLFYSKFIKFEEHLLSPLLFFLFFFFLLFGFGFALLFVFQPSSSSFFIIGVFPSACTCRYENLIHVWDANEPFHLLRTLDGHVGTVYALAVMPQTSPNKTVCKSCFFFFFFFDWPFPFLLFTF